MISLQKPFPAKGLAELVLKIASQDPAENLPFEVCRPGGKLSRMIQSMIHKNSDLRPCIEDVLKTQLSRDVIQELAESTKKSFKAVSELCRERLRKQELRDVKEEEEKNVEIENDEEEDNKVISPTPLQPFAPSPALTITKKVAQRIYDELFVELQRHLKEKKMICNRHRVGRVFVVRHSAPDAMFGKLIVPWLRVKWSDWQANTNDFVGTIDDQKIVRAMCVRKDSSSTTCYILLFSSMWFSSARTHFLMFSHQNVDCITSIICITHLYQ